MRLTVARLRRVVKADLPIEFVPQQLTSYGGLELLRRYFRLLGLHRRIRQAWGSGSRRRRRRWGRPVGIHSNRALSAGLSTGVAHISP